MKILHLSYSDQKGGASRAALRIHQCLLRKNINSFLQVNINTGKYDNTKNILRPNFYLALLNKLKSAIESRISNILREDNFVKNSISLFPTSLHKKINSSDFDIINLHWVNGETISIEDISKIKKPIVWTMHDMWPFCGSEHYTFNKRWKAGYFNYNKAKKQRLMDLDIAKYAWSRKFENWNGFFYLVGVSKWLTRCASESYLMKSFPSITINNTLDVKFWKPENKKNSRKYFNLPDDFKVVGFGSLGYQNTNLKGKDLFLKAIKEIKYDKKKIIFLTIGDSNNFFEIEDKIKIISIPRLEKDIEIKKFYNSLDLIVVPSRIESFGQTASESIACGVPVVCFDITGLKDIVFHKLNGWLASAYNPKNLAQGIDYILNLKTNEYRKMSKSCVQLAKKKFSYDSISHKYIKLYKKILNQK